MKSLSQQKAIITLFTSVEGHLSIAEAIQQSLADKYTVHTFISRDALFDLYLPIYRFFPGIFKFVYNFGKNKVFRAIANVFLLHKYHDTVFSFNEQHQADLCMSVYFMYNPSLDKYVQKKHIDYINIIPDPRTTHPLYVSSLAQPNVVFDEAHQRECLKLRSNAAYAQLGWFVREEYQPPQNKKKAKEHLSLDSEKLTFLITSGSEGTHLVTSILPSLIAAKASLQIIVACGNNQLLLKDMEMLAQQTEQAGGEVSIIPLPFTKELYKYMQAADLVIGKAGPNSIFEAAATLTPFFAITHIAGQEDGNLDIIRERNLGYVEENPTKAAQLIKEIITQPEILQTFEPSLKELATYNRETKKKFLTLVEELLQKHPTLPS